VKVSVPAALEPDELAKTELTELAAIGEPAVAVAGSVAVAVGFALATTVSDMPELHVLTAGLLLESPP